MSLLSEILATIADIFFVPIVDAVSEKLRGHPLASIIVITLAIAAIVLAILLLTR